MSEFWLGVSVGAFVGIAAMLALALCMKASEADEALERFASEWREDRSLYIARGLDVPVPPKDDAA